MDSVNGTAEVLWQTNCMYKNGRQFLYSRGVGWLWWVAHESFHGDHVQPTFIWSACAELQWFYYAPSALKPVEPAQTALRAKNDG